VTDSTTWLRAVHHAAAAGCPPWDGIPHVTAQRVLVVALGLGLSGRKRGGEGIWVDPNALGAGERACRYVVASLMHCGWLAQTTTPARGPRPGMGRKARYGLRVPQ